MLIESEGSLLVHLQKSGTVPGVGIIHAPFALLPVSFPEDYFRQACELAPIFNELFDRVSLDAKFLQDSLSRFVFNVPTMQLKVAQFCILVPRISCLNTSD